MTTQADEPLRERYNRIARWITHVLTAMHEDAKPDFDPAPMGFLQLPTAKKMEIVALDDISLDKHEAYDGLKAHVQTQVATEPDMVAGWLWAAYKLDEKTHARTAEIIAVAFEHPTSECMTLSFLVTRNEGAAPTITQEMLEFTAGPSQGRMANLFDRPYPEKELLQ